jgi:predicted  nucleic acid-binding Zn ribbon protein
MTPESQKNSLLGNGGKQVPAEKYTHATIKELPASMQRRGKHISVTIEELLGNDVFYVVLVELL